MIAGRHALKSSQKAFSDFRLAFLISGSSISSARSMRSSRVAISSMPLRTHGRQTLKRISSSSVCNSRVAKPRPVEIPQSASLSQFGRYEILSRDWTQLLVAAMKRSRSSRGWARIGASFGSMRRRRTFAVVDFAEPCRPYQDRIRAFRPHRG